MLFRRILACCAREYPCSSVWRPSRLAREKPNNHPFQLPKKCLKDTFLRSSQLCEGKPAAASYEPCSYRSGARALPVKSPACAVSLSPENSSGVVEKFMENPQNPSTSIKIPWFLIIFPAIWWPLGGIPIFRHTHHGLYRPFFWLGQGSVSMIQKIHPLMFMKFLFIYIYICLYIYMFIYMFIDFPHQVVINPTINNNKPYSHP